MKFRSTLLALCLASGAAQAADNGFYLGAGALRSDFKLDETLDSKDTGFKLIAGLRLLDSFGVEVNYADFGKSTLPTGIACIALVGVDCPSQVDVDAKSTSAFAVGFLAFPLIDLFGKAGLSVTQAKTKAPGTPAFNDKDNSTDFAWGVGAQAHFGSLAVRGEFERFKFYGDEKLNVASLSFIYTFL